MVNFKGVIDTTFRDGQQSPLLFDTGKYRFTTEEKKLLVKGLIDLGVTYIEFFSPIVSSAEKQDFIEIIKYIKTISNKNIFLLAHCRCNKNDIKQAMDAGFDGLNLFIGISDMAQKYSLGKKFSELIHLVKKTIKQTRRKYPKAYIRFSAEDSFRTPMKDLFCLYDKIEEYVNTFGLPDTVGIATPELVRKRIKLFKKRYHDINLECHFHNDRGLAIINSLTAIESGAEFIDTSIWGLAERSGITSITGLILNLYYSNRKLTDEFNLELCYPLNVLFGSILDIQVPYNEPVSLTNRTHIAGVHQKAVINNHKTYESNHLERFGVTENQLLFGPLSGWNLFYYYLREVGNYDVSKDMAKEISREFKKSAKKLKHIKPERLLTQILDKYPLVKKQLPEKYSRKRYENLSISSEN